MQVIQILYNGQWIDLTFPYNPKSIPEMVEYYNDLVKAFNGDKFRIKSL